MSDNLVIETRSRSRSKTPGLLSNENGDSKGAKKIPTVSLIEEEEDVIGVSSQPSQRPKRQRRSAKNATSDTSGDTQLETVVSNSKQSKSTVTATTTTTIIQTSKQTTNGTQEKSEESTSVKTITHTASNNDATEFPESQSIFNNIFNAIKTSTPILSTKRTKRTTLESSSSTGNVDFNLHPAYKEYKEAGEYWNKFPKTDYTYSELSPHRRELGAGIVAMPNMSRKSLDKYQNRIEAMIQQNPTEESFIRRKFLSNMSYQKKAADLQYDSADEVDVSDLYKNLSARRNSEKNVFSRFIMFVIGVFSSSYSNLKRKVSYGSKQHISYTPIKRHHQQGFWRGIYNFAQSFVLLCISKVYLFISTVLCLDTWLLYTRSENVHQNQKRKRFLIGLLVLLPLMLFGGTYIYLDPPQNISFSQISLPKMSLPKIAFPSITIPKISFDFIKWPEFSLPSLPEWFKFPKITMPTISFPSISLPQISFDFIKFSWPEFSLPLWLKFPEFTFSLPSWFRLPSFSFNLPDFSFNWPELSFEWLKMPEISFTLPAWFKLPEFNFSMPSISSDFLNSIISYTADVFGSAKSTSIEFLDKIRSVTIGLLNEFQIVWNENFNIK